MIPEKYLIDFEKLEVGQELYYVGYGKCKLNKIKNHNLTFPIEVEFDNWETLDFTKQGALFSKDKYPTLFLSNPYEKEDFKERLMLVSDNGVVWYKRKVTGIYKDKYLCFIDENEKDFCFWEYAKEIETQTFTISQAKEKLAELLKIDSNEIEIK